MHASLNIWTDSPMPLAKMKYEDILNPIKLKRR